MKTSPERFTKRDATRSWVQDCREAGLRVGLVPTMGALHRGHLHLVEAARRTCDRTLVTIFVNPTQFGPHEDLAKYPRQLEEDLRSLADIGASAVFAPSEEEMYSADDTTRISPPRVAQRWEGKHRPGHFEGVATVVLKLFLIAPAHQAHFGRKDYQQVRVIQQMVKDLCIPIEVHVEETIRDAHGLALSSRNRYLDAAEREQALAIPRAWRSAQSMFAEGVSDTSKLEFAVHDTLAAAGIVDVDYAVVVDGHTLEPVRVANERCVVLVAARVGSTRLIDNATLGESVTKEGGSS